MLKPEKGGKPRTEGSFGGNRGYYPGRGDTKRKKKTRRKKKNDTAIARNPQRRGEKMEMVSIREGRGAISGMSTNVQAIRELGVRGNCHHQE